MALLARIKHEVQRRRVIRNDVDRVVPAITADRRQRVEVRADRVERERGSRLKEEGGDHLARWWPELRTC